MRLHSSGVRRNFKITEISFHVTNQCFLTSPFYPTISITFGAVGDIISVALLVKDLIATLDEARGSKAEYRAAVQAIKILNDTINLVNHHVIQ